MTLSDCIRTNLKSAFNIYKVLIIIIHGNNHVLPSV